MVNFPGDTVLEPADLLQTVVRRRQTTSAGFLGTHRDRARRELTDAAQRFVIRLAQLSADTGLTNDLPQILTGDPDESPLVMTGHQPTLFHPGITFKYLITEQSAAVSDAIGLSVIIDTDQGDAGRFPAPEFRTNYAESLPPAEFPSGISEYSVCESDGLFLRQKLKSPDVLREMADDLETRLAAGGCTAAAESSAAALRRLALLGGRPAVDALTAFRRAFGIGRRLLEIPLSGLMCLTSVCSVVGDLLSDPVALADTYNSCLEQYRRDHAIRNDANPFPSLARSDERHALPFWVIRDDAPERSVLWFDSRRNQFTDDRSREVFGLAESPAISASLQSLAASGVQIIPRGAMITALMRTLFSDLFVHGTGGGNYDRFTDQFIREWWGVTPPPFAVASASVYLFHSRREQLQRLNRIAEELRDMQFNPDRFFGSGTFPDADERRIKDLWTRKSALLRQLKEARESGISGREIGSEIQAVGNQIRDAVSEIFAAPLQLRKSISTDTAAAVNCRTYPWFLAEHGADRTSADR